MSKLSRRSGKKSPAGNPTRRAPDVTPPAVAPKPAPAARGSLPLLVISIVTLAAWLLVLLYLALSVS